MVRSGLDIIGESWMTIAHRPGRTLLAASASALGIAVLVTTIGITQTLSNQVTDQFDALRATQVLVRSADTAQESMPIEADVSVNRIDGVVSSGMISRIGALAVRHPGNPESALSVDIVAATPAALEVLELTLSSGRLYDGFHQANTPNVVLVGKDIATRLGFASPDGTASLTIDGDRFLILGIVDNVGRRPAMQGELIIPLTTSYRTRENRNLEEFLVKTTPGAAGVVAERIPYAIMPTAPDDITTSAPPDPTTFRRGVEDNLRTSLIAIGLTVLVVGLLSIANAAFVSVLERSQEIGVRRALGARPIHIWLQVVVETAAIGAIGGLVGSSLATIALVTISTVQQWTPSIPAIIPFAGPALGALAGILAGFIPARRAIQIHPTEALRL